MAASPSDVVSTIGNAALSAVAGLDPTGIAQKVLTLATNIYEQYTQMKRNTEVVGELSGQVNIIRKIVAELSEKEQVDYCQESLKELVKCLEQCSKLFSSMTVKKSAMEKLKGFLNSDKTKDLIARLTRQLKDMTQLLELALTVETNATVKQMFQAQEAIKIAAIQQEKQETQQEEEVETFVKTIQAINEGNVHLQEARAGGDITGVGRIGGNANFSQETITQGASDQKEEPMALSLNSDLTNVQILEKLIGFFQDGAYAGVQTGDLEAYNKVLAHHKARLGYNSAQQKHTLYVSYKSVDPEHAIDLIIEMMSTLEMSAAGNEKSAMVHDAPSSSAINRGNVNAQGASAGKDMTVVGDVGGNADFSRRSKTITTAYDQRNSHTTHNASKFTIGSISGPVQAGDNNTQHNTALDHAPRP